MFKRLVSNLPYSPALIGQVGFYAQRLKQEEATRRLGLIFTALALVVQSFAVFNPPEAQAIASPQNVVFQGIDSKAELMRIYDSGVDQAGHTDIRQIFTHFGIDREDLLGTRIDTFNSRDFNGGIWSVGRNSYDAGTKHEQEHRIKSKDSTVYARKLWRYDSLPLTVENGSSYRGLAGYRDDGSWFSVSLDNGNIAYTSLPSPHLSSNSKQSIPSSDPTASFIKSKSVSNTTRGLEDATNATAEAGDRMVYILRVKNIGNEAGSHTTQDNLSDVLEYADVVDVGGGTLEISKSGNPTGLITWPAQEIKVQETISRSVTVRLKQVIPASPQNVGNPESYNCIMTNSFGNATNIMVDCPPAKQLEQVASQLPSTSSGTNILFGGTLLTVVAYFWARSRQLKKEVKLLRKEFASGGF